MNNMDDEVFVRGVYGIFDTLSRHTLLLFLAANDDSAKNVAFDLMRNYPNLVMIASDVQLVCIGTFDEEEVNNNSKHIVCSCADFFPNVAMPPIELVDGCKVREESHNRSRDKPPKKTVLKRL